MRRRRLAGKNPRYQAKLAGDIAETLPGAKLNQVKTPYEIAKEGGKHENWYKEQLILGVNQLRNGIRSIEKQVDRHVEWINKPDAKVTDWDVRSDKYRAGLLAKWNQDIRRQMEQIDILRGVLSEKEKKDG